MDQRKAMDNPFWPNSSAVAKAKDASANLPLPAVSGAEWILSEHDIDCITAGAGILASGGGGDPNIGKMSAMRVLKDGIEIKITNPCRCVCLCGMCVWHLGVNSLVSAHNYIS